jgi:hypothetical protein
LSSSKCMAPVFPSSVFSLQTKHIVRTTGRIVQPANGNVRLGIVTAIH